MCRRRDSLFYSHECHPLNPNIPISLSSPSTHLVHLVIVTSIVIVTHHGSITFVSQCSLRRLQLTVMPALRVSSVAVYGGHGEAVKLCVDAISHSSPLLSTNTVSSCLMCAVNANELERLKKRFMKLDRCHPSPSPHPAALCCCPLP